MRPWIVTGAGGHLGRQVTKMLLSRGVAVRAWVGRRAAIDGCDAVSIDVRDRERVAREIGDVAGVIHLAAKISLDARDEAAMLEVNERGAANVAAACAAAGVRMIHASSIHAFDPSPSDEAVDEARPLAIGAHHFAYDRSKARGEAAVRESGVDTFIVNPTGMMGPDDDGPSELGVFVQRLVTRSMPGLVDASFDFCDVRDVAHVIVKATSEPRRGRYILSGERRSLATIARAICTRAGVPAPKMVSPLWLARATAPFAVGWARITKTAPLYTPASLATLARYRKIDSGLARRELGWKPRPLDETIADTAAWWKART